MTTGRFMKTPTWDGPLVKAVTGVGVFKLALTLVWIMTGSEAKARTEESPGLAGKL